MKRRLLNFLTALSVLLCVAVVGLWVRSIWVSDTLNWVNAQDAPAIASWTSLYSGGGAFGVGRMECKYLGPNAEAAAQGLRLWLPRWQSIDGATLNSANLLPTALTHVQNLSNRNSSSRYIQLPYWIPTALLLPLPLVRLRSHVHQRRSLKRLRTALCPRCGYDLRATPARCPECGTHPPPTPTAV
jgi:hypothetical protein